MILVLKRPQAYWKYRHMPERRTRTGRVPPHQYMAYDTHTGFAGHLTSRAHVEAVRWSSYHQSLHSLLERGYVIARPVGLMVPEGM